MLEIYFPRQNLTDAVSVGLETYLVTMADALAKKVRWRRFVGSPQYSRSVSFVKLLTEHRDVFLCASQRQDLSNARDIVGLPRGRTEEVVSLFARRYEGGANEFLWEQLATRNAT